MSHHLNEISLSSARQCWRDCKINGVTPEMEGTPVTVVAVDVAAEPAGAWMSGWSGSWSIGRGLSLNPPLEFGDRFGSFG
jgi:hypothetical protein